MKTLGDFVYVGVILVKALAVVIGIMATSFAILAVLAILPARRSFWRSR
jgi:hypothetical protein